MNNGQSYYVIPVAGTDKIQLATTLEDALAGNPIALTSLGASRLDVTPSSPSA